MPQRSVIEVDNLLHLTTDEEERSWFQKYPEVEDWLRYAAGADKILPTNEVSLLERALSRNMMLFCDELDTVFSQPDHYYIMESFKARKYGTQPIMAWLWFRTEIVQAGDVLFLLIAAATAYIRNKGGPKGSEPAVQYARHLEQTLSDRIWELESLQRDRDFARIFAQIRYEKRQERLRELQREGDIPVDSDDDTNHGMPPSKLQRTTASDQYGSEVTDNESQ